MNGPKLVKKVNEFVKSLAKGGGKPLYELTPQEARQVLLSVQSEEQDLPQTNVDKFSIPLENGREMPMVIVRPDDVDDMLPVIFYIHGGGWVMGDDKTHDRLIRVLADAVPAAVVFPVYEQSPEAQYPQTTNDLFIALQYIVEYAAKYNLDASHLVVAGDSVGGNMATVMALMAKKNNFEPEIDFQLLFYPVTSAKLDSASYEQFAEGPWLTKKAMEWFWEAYAPNKAQRKEIYVSPLLASLEELKDLPPALVLTAENDVLRDEGEAYAQKLNEAGVDAASVRFNGTIHDFVMLNALADTVPSKAAMALAVLTLQDVLSEEDEAEE